MSTINRTMYPLQASYTQIARMQQQFAKLQIQLATGQKATNLAEMGNDRHFDLSTRARISRIQAYQDNISTVNLRLDIMNQAMSRLVTLQTEARSGMAPGAYGTGNENYGAAPALAASRLDEVVVLLNSDVAGRRVFGGSTTDRDPVETVSTLLNGAGGKAGFRQIASERQAADVGDGLGRLTLGTAADTTTLTEDGAHPFGLKLSTLFSTSADVTLTQPSGGAPKSLAIKFDAPPTAGTTVTLGFTMPDGTEEQLTLTAVTGSPGAGEFQIGQTADATAANFGVALNTAVGRLAGTSLVAASNFAAADNFFNGQGVPVQRVDGPPFDTATALKNADAGNTVFWYKGQDSADPRGAVTSKIDEATNVRYGVQANESGLRGLIQSLAVVAIQNFPVGDSATQARFDAVATRNVGKLSDSHNPEAGSIAMISVELGNTQATVTAIGDRHFVYEGQLLDLLSDLESAPNEEIAAQLLALQTRLTASYQATAMISQLSFVNYLK